MVQNRRRKKEYKLHKVVDTKYYHLRRDLLNKLFFYLTTSGITEEKKKEKANNSNQKLYQLVTKLTLKE